MEVGEQERAARRQNAGEFPHCRRLIANVTQGQRADDQIGRRTRDGKRGGIGYRKPAAQGGLRRRPGEHGGGGSQADRRETLRPAAGTAPNVDCAAGVKTGNPREKRSMLERHDRRWRRVPRIGPELVPFTCRNVDRAHYRLSHYRLSSRGWRKRTTFCANRSSPGKWYAPIA